MAARHGTIRGLSIPTRGVILGAPVRSWQRPLHVAPRRAGLGRPVRRQAHLAGLSARGAGWALPVHGMGLGAQGNVNLLHMSHVCNVDASQGTLRARSAQQHRVILVDVRGNRSLDILTVTDLLRGCSSLNVRDLLSFLVDPELRAPSAAVAQSANSVLFARGDTLLCSLGWLQALIDKDRAIIVDGGLHCDVFADKLCALLLSHEEPLDKGSDERLLYAPDFEMKVVEKMLQECCESFDRRYLIFHRMLEYFFSHEEEANADATSLLRLVPLRDALQGFIMEINQTREALLTLLDNEDDMLDLLLSKKARAHEQGVAMLRELHDEVEFLLEYYVRALNRTHSQAVYLQYRLKTKQELAAISLDVYRNSLLRIDLQLSLAGMGIGCATVISGAFGMNLASGIEEVPGLFWPAAAGCAAAGLAVYIALAIVIRRSMLERQACDCSVLP